MSTLYVLPSLSECVRTLLSSTVHGTARHERALRTLSAGSTKKSENPSPNTKNTAKNAARQPAACIGVADLRESARCCGSASDSFGFGLHVKARPPTPTATNTRGKRMARSVHRLGLWSADFSGSVPET